MSKNVEMLSTPTSPVLVIETLTIEKSSFTIIIEKKHFVNIQSLFTRQKKTKI